MGASEIAKKMLPILLVQHLSKSDRRIEIILAYESKTKTVSVHCGETEHEDVQHRAQSPPAWQPSCKDYKAELV